MENQIHSMEEDIADFESSLAARWVISLFLHKAVQELTQAY